MKRSDSINKRWSAQAGSGLKRGDSITSTRGKLGNPSAVTWARGGSPPRESCPIEGASSSPITSSRPTSSHSTSTTVQMDRGAITSLSSTAENRSLTSDDESSSSLHGLGNPSRSLDRVDTLAHLENVAYKVPVSPSKTMDPKRWSPTKASWLESALSKPESPKIVSPKPEQPSWKIGLQRSKEAKADPDKFQNPATSFNVVTPTGLLRSPPPGGHARPLSISGIPEGISPVLVKKTPTVPPKFASLQSTSPQPSGEQSCTSTESPSEGKGSSQPNEESRSNNPELTEATEARSSPISKQEPPVIKPKPQTPPKTDFRANLKSRPKGSQGSKGDELEFKNVFGKLRRIETKNYVAPDELKDNIMRGKAALSVTGGPQKTKRIDEFKESLISQREAMKVGGGSVNKKSENDDTRQKPAPPIQEALARRRTLSKTAEPVIEKAAISTSRASIKATESKSHTIAPSNPSSAGPETRGSQHLPAKPKELQRAAAIQSVGITQPPPNLLDNLYNLSNGDAKLSESSAQLPPASSAPTIGMGNNGLSGKLARRLNPDLAGVLMRRPVSNAGSRSQSTEDPAMSTALSRPSDSGVKASDGQLTHMTKGRAKGPKRRLPKPGSDTNEGSPQPKKAPASNHLPPHTLPSPESCRVSPIASKSLKSVEAVGPSPSSTPIGSSTPRPMATLINQNDKAPPHTESKKFNSKPETDSAAAVTGPAPEKPKPAVAAKSPKLKRVSSPKSDETETSLAVKQSEAKRPPSPLASKKSSPSKPLTTDIDIRKPASQTQRVIDEQPQGSVEGTLTSDSKPGPETPKTKKPFVEAKKTAQLGGLGVNFSPSKPDAVNAARKESVQPEYEKAGVPAQASQIATSPRLAGRDPVANDVSRNLLGRRASQILSAFFDSYPKIKDAAEVDTQKTIVTNFCAAEKSRTLHKQIWEVTGDGKRLDMPPQQEHILFEECMYLLVHFSESSKGTTTTKVCLWVGDSVSEAAVEDSQLFCRKVARENSSKLELLRQGKETASFIQALGGILITRQAKNKALYMLCGRKHLGHVVFDELDFDSANLCPGFPYLISASFGKLYLWKGRGSGADELSCARLIGMDLSLTGEIEEIVDGEEPATFWDAFPAGSSAQARRVPGCGGHWGIKKQFDKYACRLYRVETERPKSSITASLWSRRGSSPDKGGKIAAITEVSPFSQRDLEEDHVFVLDVYNEIYL